MSEGFVYPPPPDLIEKLRTIISTKKPVEHNILWAKLEYEDEKIIISGLVKDTVSGIHFLRVFLKMRDPQQPLPAKSRRSIGFSSGDLDDDDKLTFVFETENRNGNHIAIYNRPGLWVKYIDNLYQDLLNRGKAYSKLHRVPVDDKDLFPDIE